MTATTAANHCRKLTSAADHVLITIQDLAVCHT